MNKLLVDRLGAIRRGLVAAHGGGAGMSSATIGREREHFVSTFLGNVLPTPLRVGTGDIIDSGGGHSGQLDTVIENPYHPSFPIMSGAPRLYLAEGVAAVVEVKSSLDGQWNEVKATAEKVKPLRRAFSGVALGGAFPPVEIPLIAVGYTGWKRLETVVEKAQEGPADAILVIDAGFCSIRNSNVVASGDHGLLLLMECVRSTFATLLASHTSLLPYMQ